MRRRALLLVALSLLPALTSRAATGSPPPAHELRDCTLYVDATPEQLKTLAFRFERVFDNYQAMFAGFKKKLTHKPGVYLVPKGTWSRWPGGGGVSVGRDVFLTATGPDSVARYHWGGIQHELLHQFVRACVGNVPRWTNEGLASYCARTQDSGVRFHAGMLSHDDIADVKRMLANPALSPFDDYFCKPSPGKLNYLRNWSLVFFLMHDDGAYHGKYWAALQRVSGGAKWWDVWAESFDDAVALEAAYRRYWTTMPEDAGDAGQAEPRVEALTLALADANAAGQRFTTFAAFAAAAKAGRLARRAADWRPAVFVDDPIAWAADNGRWSIDGTSLACLLDDGTRLVGTFDATKADVATSVHVTTTPRAGAAVPGRGPTTRAAGVDVEDEPDAK